MSDIRIRLIPLVEDAPRIDWNVGEAPDDAPFGKWAWPQHREGCPFEPPTDLETKVYKELCAHFRSSNGRLSFETAELLMELMKKGFYKRVLHPPPVESLYQGVKLSDGFRDFLSLDPVTIAPEGAANINRTLPVRNGYSSSWSAVKKATREFSDKGTSGFAVTLIADVAANPFRFMAGPGGLYDVDGMARWTKERETVGLEPIVVRRVEWKRLG